MTAVIVSDSSSLIMTGKLARLDLLENLFEQVLVPARVAEELAVKEDGVAKLVLAHPAFTIANTTDHELLAFLDGTLDYGEAEAIALARERRLILLVDEKKARKIARNMGLKIVGLLGVLLLNRQKGHLSKQEAMTLLEQVKQLDFRLSAKLERDFLARLE